MPTNTIKITYRDGHTALITLDGTKRTIKRYFRGETIEFVPEKKTPRRQRTTGRRRSTRLTAAGELQPATAPPSMSGKS